MAEKLLSAAEIKNNTKLRKLIKDFLESDEDVPQGVFDYLKEMKGKSRVLAPVDISDENMSKFKL